VQEPDLSPAMTLHVTT